MSEGEPLNENNVATKEPAATTEAENGTEAVNGDAQTTPGEGEGEEAAKDEGAAVNGDEEGEEAATATAVSGGEDRTEGMELTGKCKWFNNLKGFGFIHEVSDSGPEVFVHNSAISMHEGQVASLAPNMDVKFKVKIDTDGRFRATDVTMPDGNPIRLHASRRNPTFSKRLAEEKNTEVKLGWCKWFNPTKGYGFITQEDSSAPEVFVHQNAITFHTNQNRTIASGQDLEFRIETEMKDGKESMRAVEVTGPGGLPLTTTPVSFGVTPTRVMSLMPGRSATLLGKRAADTALLQPNRGNPMYLAGRNNTLLMQQPQAQGVRGMAMNQMGQMGQMRMMGMGGMVPIQQQPLMRF